MSKSLMQGCEVSADQLEVSLEQLRAFLEEYRPCFGRCDTAANAELYVSGLVSSIPRKLTERIAEFHGVHRRPLQYFVGAPITYDDAILNCARFVPHPPRTITSIMMI